MAEAPASKSLKELLAEQLPKDVPFTFYHYSTPPSRSSALFSAPPHGKPEKTYCESHLLAAAITTKSSNAAQLPEELLVLAIEVLVYSTRNLTTIFISKADSTGCLSELQLPRSQSGSPLKAICGSFVAWLAKERQREGKKLVVSLFARAQDQYLFPASIENKNKHVLDDKALVRWWCRTLDPMVWEYKAEEDQKPFTERLTSNDENGTPADDPQAEITAKGYLVIPGFDPYDTLRYTPTPSPPHTKRRWVAAHPLLKLAPHPAAPPRCLVPHFPDDPKARYLDELDEELPDRGAESLAPNGGTPSRSNGQWKSIKTLDQFWECMGFRQECSSGRIVGFIWVVLTPMEMAVQEVEEPLSQQTVSQSLSTGDSQSNVTAPKTQKKKLKSKIKKPKTDFGPIPHLLPRIKQTASGCSTAVNNLPTSGPTSSKVPPESTQYYTWPTTSRGTICFSTKNYNRAHEILLHSNFESPASTARATKRWREEIAVLGGVREWSWIVTGRKESVQIDNAQSNGTIAAPTVVMGVKKKRKTDNDTGGARTVEATSNGAQILGEGLVRKKTKIEPSSVVDSAALNGVNTLTAGLVRKKPKA